MPPTQLWGGPPGPRGFPRTRSPRHHLKAVKTEARLMHPHLGFNLRARGDTDLKHPYLRTRIGENARERLPVRRHQMNDGHGPVVGGLERPRDDPRARSRRARRRRVLRPPRIFQSTRAGQVNQANQAMKSLRWVDGVLLPADDPGQSAEYYR